MDQSESLIEISTLKSSLIESYLLENEKGVIFFPA